MELRTWPGTVADNFARFRFLILQIENRDRSNTYDTPAYKAYTKFSERGAAREGERKRECGSERELERVRLREMALAD